ncbi:Phthioceranic/hydroxyphthioceranic acid synthase [Xenorhabdus mauleonii]|uniref:NADPH:quinone reductase n=1 Tax=Xenorhabdus mauleonii TaxID=351675 RepID=A0A1I3P6H1_9GAMM|nr:alcohol dehydrogenase catalytic domain-containing protein [Xenorhabdus mauleonii]PHM44905.1 Phthioceranic/hydroxyphthioceranic acid synthase [Xenorhabdus mauleonii]SFJ16950.1 NADPH:quinone reductase [Xenorhabdus mauleonii]
MISTKAWQWLQNPDPLHLSLGTKELPELKEHQVLIENHAVGLNPVDWKLLSGLSDNWEKYQIPGIDGMGVVIDTGKNVNHIRLGTRVAYFADLNRDGSFSQYTIVDAKALLVIPNSLSDLSAAAFPCAGLTAYQAMSKVPFLAGKNVLVNGAGGAVGSLLCQLLVSKGAIVHAVASSHRHDFLRARGVKATYDYHQPHWREELKQAPLYAAFDMVSNQSALFLAPMLEYYGHLVCVQDRVESAPLAAFTTCISLHEVGLGAIYTYGNDYQWNQLVKEGEALLQQISRGELMLPKIKTIAFEEIPTALNLLLQKNEGTKYVAVL